MKLGVMSDLHLDHRTKELGLKLLEKIYYRSPEDIDVLIIAGDVSGPEQLPFWLDQIEDIFYEFDPLYCFGNHEFYGKTRDEVINLSKVETRLEMKWFDCNSMRVPWAAGSNPKLKIHGTPLWFPETENAKSLEKYFSDFYYIKDYASWVYKENVRAIEYLENNVKEGDVIFSHHLPSFNSVHWKFQNSDSNCYFVCDMSEFIIRKKPALWVHGHTHMPMDYKLGDTRIVCNPLGYPSEVNGDYFIKTVEI